MATTKSTPLTPMGFETVPIISPGFDLPVFRVADESLIEKRPGGSGA